MTGSARLALPVAFWVGLVAALAVLWWSGQAGRAWEQIRAARAAPLALVIGIGVLLPLIHARRWQLVMQALGNDLPGRLAADLTVSASLVNYAGPGFLGAPAKAYLANKTARVPYTRSLIAMAFEQGLDFLVLVAGSLVALAMLGPARQGALLPRAGWSPGSIAVVAAGIAAVSAIVIARERFRQIAGRVVEAFRALGARVDRAPVAGLTLSYWLAQAAVVGLLLWALRLPVGLTTLLALATLPLLAGQVVPLPGGIGAREVAIVALSGVTDTSSSGLLGLAVLQRVLLVAALPLALALLRVPLLMRRAW
jgi:uncharacterized membrane protein YbhN (UPF0104 family)